MEWKNQSVQRPYSLIMGMSYLHVRLILFIKIILPWLLRLLQVLSPFWGLEVGSEELGNLIRKPMHSAPGITLLEAKLC